MPKKKTAFEIQANRFEQLTEGITSKQKKYSLSQLQILEHQAKVLIKKIQQRRQETEDKILLMKAKKIVERVGDLDKLSNLLDRSDPTVDQTIPEEILTEKRFASFDRNSKSSTQPTPFGER